ncbi:hypothetical protein [Parasitella parasitica]|uniref:BZIP domain-containing protein n=1 Tax=Parasitella parasitica TaxID=35722 RepID=A0A0B7MVQ8_9FUNG|nr:hypothetical protein [Parasitella parasitica]
MENEQETTAKQTTSPQQILNTAENIKLGRYKELFDPQFLLSQSQSSNTDGWADGVTSEMLGTQGFDQPHPFDSIYENNQIPFYYNRMLSPQEQPLQKDSNIGLEQFNFSQHRNSLPILQDTATFTPSSTISSALTMPNMQTLSTTPVAPPYNRRYTEGSIPASSTSSSTSTSNRKSRKQRISSVSSSGKEDDDEESKRKHFLERNRQAALKCRQRKKQWLANLQHRVEFLSTDNEQLQSQATMLREEVINLKTLLLAHRDCKTFNENMAANGNTLFSLNLDNSKNSFASNTDHKNLPDNAKR